MSKYTTEVRFICEKEAGLDESEGFASVDDIIASSWNKIFTTKCEFFDENYRGVLCRNILKHYYLREIGAETVGVWKLWVNTKLEEIMPYYNQLYLSAKLEFNPFHDVDLTRKHLLNFDGKTNTKDSGTRGTNTNENGTNYRLYSDTPQGALTGVESETYLTDATKTTDTNTTNMAENTETTGTTDTTNTEDYIETVVGKQGTENYSSLLQKFRDTFLNIDMMVIEDFSELFLNLW